MTDLSRESFVSRIDRLSQQDLCRLNAHCTYLACTKGDNPETGHSSVKSLRENVCWYDYEVANESRRGPMSISGELEIHRVIATAVPSFLKARSSQEIDALVDFMVELVKKSWPLLASAQSNFTRFGSSSSSNNNYEVVNFYCLCDTPLHLTPEMENQFLTIERRLKSEANILKVDQCGPISYETLADTYLGHAFPQLTQETRQYCNHIFEQYRRLVFSYDMSGRLNIRVNRDGPYFMQD